MQGSYLTISELAELLNSTLEDAVGQVAFSGEIHQLTRAQSGHVYFDLKDESSKISAVMWQGVTRSLSFRPEAGIAVVCYGRPNVWARSGRLQMVVSRMELAGEGALQKKFLALKAALEKEGLFRADRKRALPLLPRAVGIVTSASGAAIHDMLVKLNERMPSMKKYIFDARVQGEGAAEEIAAGIEYFNASGLVDVVIIGRGGGSLEDLWAFNEEVLVRAVFGSAIPVVSGVGHEVDVALTDLAADVRAPTPTAAAELVVPHRDELMKRLLELYRRLSDTERWLRPLQQALDEAQFSLEAASGRQLARARLQFESAHSKIRSIEPVHRIGMFAQRLDDWQRRLYTSVDSAVRERHLALDRAASRLQFERELKRLDTRRGQLDSLENALSDAARRSLKAARQSLASKENLLESVSHRRVLERGYALVEAGGSVLRSTESVHVHDAVSVTLARGRFTATVSDIHNERGDTDEP